VHNKQGRVRGKVSLLSFQPSLSLSFLPSHSQPFPLSQALDDHAAPRLIPIENFKVAHVERNSGNSAEKYLITYYVTGNQMPIILFPSIIVQYD
jgi:hypothetical protein